MKLKNGLLLAALEDKTFSLVLLLLSGGFGNRFAKHPSEKILLRMILFYL